MFNPFVCRLAQGVRLTEVERTVLARLTRNTHHVAAREALVHEGGPVGRTFVVLEGWAYRWKGLPNGKRQITDLLLPGDIVQAHVELVAQVDHALGTLTSCTLSIVPPAELAVALNRWPGVRRALLWSSLQTDSVLREALTNNGCRQAEHRLAHLICEVMARLRSAGVPVDAGRVPWPITQEQLGELMSLTSVHVNRSLRALRGAGLVEIRPRALTVPDIDRLAAHGGFHPGYLHLACPDCVSALDGESTISPGRSSGSTLSDRYVRLPR